MSEGIDLTKQVHQKSDICRYWYFINKAFKFQTYVCNRRHDLLMMSMILSDMRVKQINR